MGGWQALALVALAVALPCALFVLLKVRPYHRYKPLELAPGEQVLAEAWAHVYLGKEQAAQPAHLWLTNLRLYASPSKGGYGAFENPISLPFELIVAVGRQKLRPADFGLFVPIRIRWHDPYRDQERELHLQVSRTAVPLPWTIVSARWLQLMIERLQAIEPSPTP